MVCDRQHGGAISPSFFRDPRTGNNYLLYKTNGPKAIRRIWLQRLSDSRMRTVGRRTLLGKRPWNYENPQLVFSRGRYFLFVSRDLYRTPEYKTTVNWASKVDGPYPIKRAHAIITKDNTGIAGPASAELVRVGGGQTIAFFHGWRQDGGQCNGPRPMYVATIDWGPNRRDPRLAKPTPGNAHC